MMKHILYIGILLLCVGLLTGCSDDVANDASVPLDGVELTAINTSLASSETLTRGAYSGGTNGTTIDTVRLKDLIGRGFETKASKGRTIDMEAGDQMVFTTIRRKNHPIPVFSYTGLVYNMQSQGSWTRDKGKGQTAETQPKNPEKIYWSDASNGHEFIGYSCPTVTAPATFDWNKSGLAYYGSIGDPTVTTIPPATVEGESTPAIIDYNNTEDGNNLIKADDILLTWADNKVADNAVANIVYHHGLALVRVIVNISGFGVNAKDRMTTVSDMILKNMPTMYKWDMTNNRTVGLTESDQTALNDISWGDGKTPPAWNQTKDVHLWLPVPAGEGDGANKTFTFYALAVPHTASGGLEFSFNVTYPDPMHPETVMKNHKYAATMPTTQNIEFRAGWCTTLKISLNHKNEQMTIGAEYMTWQFAATPDDGSLKKGEAFLSSSDYDKATYSTQTKDVNNKDITITVDNATWLYKDANDVLKDIYGNTGTEEAPYVIKTAAQFASFAKEVNEAQHDFTGQYIRMDADFYLQKSIEVTEKGMVWPGIGTSTRAFNGNIIGEMRFIRHLYGKPLFVNIGPNAHIEQLLLEEVLGITDGKGAYAEENNGIICASKVTSPNDTPFTMASSGTVGAFCGTNKGVIVGVYALGEFDPSNATSVGGLIGNNQGILAGAYTAIKITNPTMANIGGTVVSGTAGAYDFYCSDLLTPSGTGTSMTATGKTTQEMRNQNFVGSTTDTDNPDVTTLNGAIMKWAKDKYEIPEAIKSYVGSLPSTTIQGEGGNSETKTALQVLIEHLNSHYYTYQVASMPWVSLGENK
ncbi:MAG: hypothetical protein MJZ36_02925 [Bacteroidaceae bacterium]|nr:hypothetical protein [Bacteroidaceae bacterium]